MKNERIDIPAELFEDEVVCFIADRYHTSAENVVRCFLVQDGIYPEQKNEPFCQALAIELARIAKAKNGRMKFNP